MTEDEIATLDFNWTEFTTADQAAFAYARKLTLDPHQLTDADFDELRKHFSDLQILEMTLSIAGNNQTNRWKEGGGIPQSSSGGGFGRRDGTAAAAPTEPHSYLTPTSEKYRTTITKVAPLLFDETGLPTRQSMSARPPLESRTEVEQSLAECRQRTPRLPLVSETDARAVVSDDWQVEALPQWVRLLANFPEDGKRRIASYRSAEENADSLSPLLKAQVSWIIARQDRAWYATGLAYQRLKQLGWTDDQIFDLDGSLENFSDGERAMFQVARNLATAPIVLTDDDCTEAMKYFGPREVVQLVVYTTVQSSFNRITEAAGLQLEQ